MIVQIVDAVVVRDRHAARTVRNELVLCAQSVLDDKERLLPAVIIAIEHIAQSLRVDLPAPLTRLEIRILFPAEDVSTT